MCLLCNSDPRTMNNRINRHFETKGVKYNHLSQTTNWESWQQKWSTPTLCNTSSPGAGSSVKALVPFPGQLGLLELWETVDQGPKQASCLGLAPSLGQRSFLKAGGDFTITRDYSIAAYLLVVVPSQGRIRWCHSTQEGAADTFWCSVKIWLSRGGIARTRQKV